MVHPLFYPLYRFSIAYSSDDEKTVPTKHISKIINIYLQMIVEMRRLHVLLLIFITLFIVLYLMKQLRNHTYRETFLVVANEETSCPSGEYCGNDIKINEIASRSNNVMINSDVHMNTLNTLGLSSDSNNFITMNEDGKKVLGSEGNMVNIGSDNSVEFDNNIIMKPGYTMFSQDALFMNNSYFKDNLHLDRNSKLCFYDNDNKNCLKKSDIEVVMNADVADLDDKNTVLRGACISSQSMEADSLMNVQDGITNTFPLNDNMICITEASGVKKLKKWYAQKDSLEPIDETYEDETIAQ